MYRWQERRCERLLHVLVDELLSSVFQPFWTFIQRVFEWEPWRFAGMHSTILLDRPLSRKPMIGESMHS